MLKPEAIAEAFEKFKYAVAQQRDCDPENATPEDFAMFLSSMAPSTRPYQTQLNGSHKLTERLRVQSADVSSWSLYDVAIEFLLAAEIDSVGPSERKGFLSEVFHDGCENNPQKRWNPDAPGVPAEVVYQYFAALDWRCLGADSGVTVLNLQHALVLKDGRYEPRSVNVLQNMVKSDQEAFSQQHDGKKLSYDHYWILPGIYHDHRVNDKKMHHTFLVYFQYGDLLKGVLRFFDSNKDSSRAPASLLREVFDCKTLGNPSLNQPPLQKLYHESSTLKFDLFHVSESPIACGLEGCCFITAFDVALRLAITRNIIPDADLKLNKKLYFLFNPSLLGLSVKDLISFCQTLLQPTHQEKYVLAEKYVREHWMDIEGVPFHRDQAHFVIGSEETSAITQEGDRRSISSDIPRKICYWCGVSLPFFCENIHIDTEHAELANEMAGKYADFLTRAASIGSRGLFSCAQCGEVVDRYEDLGPHEDICIPNTVFFGSECDSLRRQFRNLSLRTHSQTFRKLHHECYPAQLVEDATVPVRITLKLVIKSNGKPLSAVQAFNDKIASIQSVQLPKWDTVIDTCEEALRQALQTVGFGRTDRGSHLVVGDGAIEMHPRRRIFDLCEDDPMNSAAAELATLAQLTENMIGSFSACRVVTVPRSDDEFERQKSAEMMARSGLVNIGEIEIVLGDKQLNLQVWVKRMEWLMDRYKHFCMVPPAPSCPIFDKDNSCPELFDEASLRMSVPYFDALLSTITFHLKRTRTKNSRCFILSPSKFMQVLKAVPSLFGKDTAKVLIDKMEIPLATSDTILVPLPYSSNLAAEEVQMAALYWQPLGPVFPGLNSGIISFHDPCQHIELYESMNNLLGVVGSPILERVMPSDRHRCLFAPFTYGSEWLGVESGSLFSIINLILNLQLSTLVGEEALRQGLVLVTPEVVREDIYEVGRCIDRYLCTILHYTQGSDTGPLESLLLSSQSLKKKAVLQHFDLTPPQETCPICRAAVPTKKLLTHHFLTHHAAIGKVDRDLFQEASGLTRQLRGLLEAQKSRTQVVEHVNSLEEVSRKLDVCFMCRIPTPHIFKRIHENCQPRTVPGLCAFFEEVNKVGKKVKDILEQAKDYLDFRVSLQTQSTLLTSSMGSLPDSFTPRFSLQPSDDEDETSLSNCPSCDLTAPQSTYSATSSA